MDDPPKHEADAARIYAQRTARWIALGGTGLLFSGLWLAGIRGVEDFAVPIYDDRYHMCRRTINVETQSTKEIVKVCKEWLDQRGTLHLLRDYELVQQEGKFYVVPRGPNYPLLGLLAFIGAIMAAGFSLHRMLIMKHRDAPAASGRGV